MPLLPIPIMPLIMVVTRLMIDMMMLVTQGHRGDGSGKEGVAGRKT